MHLTFICLKPLKTTTPRTTHRQSITVQHRTKKNIAKTCTQEVKIYKRYPSTTMVQWWDKRGNSTKEKDAKDMDKGKDPSSMERLLYPT